MLSIALLMENEHNQEFIAQAIYVAFLRFLLNCCEVQGFGMEEKSVSVLNQ